MATVPSQADIVIVGGGVLGTSIAFHLAKAGAKDVVLIEKNELTHGSTWHAAGMVGQLRASRNLSRMLQSSVEIYETLEAETGLASGWRRTGSLRLVSNPERLLEAKRSNTIARSFGLEADIIGPAEVKKLLPIVETADILGALYVPGDGVADPTSLTLSLAAGARKHGAKIVQRVAVTGFDRRDRRITRVRTSEGDIACRIVVNAAGVWAREIGKLMGVRLACCGLVHQYLITQPIEGIDGSMPSMRDPDLSIYYKPEANGLVFGCWEPDTVPFDAEPIPSAFGQELLPPAMDRFEPFIEAAIKRTPVLGEVGIRTVVTGPIPFSADGDFVMGPIPGLDNAFVASGCVVGIAAGGGHRATSRRRRAASEGARSTISSGRRAPCTARSSAGSGRTGSRSARRPQSVRASSARAGSRRWRRSMRPCAPRPASSISRRSRNTRSTGPTPRACCNSFRRATSPSPSAP